MKEETRAKKDFESFAQWDQTTTATAAPFVAELLRCADMVQDNQYFAAVLSLDGHFTKCGAFSAEWTGNGAQYSYFADVIAQHLGTTREKILPLLAKIITNHKTKIHAGHNNPYTEKAPRGGGEIESLISFVIDKKKIEERKKYIIDHFAKFGGDYFTNIATDDHENNTPDNRFEAFARDHREKETNPRGKR